MGEIFWEIFSSEERYNSFMEMMGNDMPIFLVETSSETIKARGTINIHGEHNVFDLLNGRKSDEVLVIILSNTPPKKI